MYGLNRPHNVALVVPDTTALAAHFGCSVGELFELPMFAKVQEFLQAEADAQQDNADTFPSYARVST